MSPLPTTSDFRSIALGRIPLIDVRAPVEYAKGSFPGAVNLPLLTDDERHEVGIVYKKQGHDQAVALGHRLVQGEVKEARVTAWVEFMSAHPDAHIFCFRGGMRSRTSQQWIHEASGIEVPLVVGGYKAFRAFLLDELERPRPETPFLVLGGRTGSGKSTLLRRYENFIDLELIANHRGSSFGHFTSTQPSQIDFEHALAYELMAHTEREEPFVLLEDEGRHIGRRYLPLGTQAVFNASPIVVLEVSMEERVENLYDDYVLEGQKEYQQVFGEEGLDRWAKEMANNLVKIRKRLGGLRYMEALSLLTQGHERQKMMDLPEEHKGWVRYLLEHYYDPMYDYQLEKRSERIIYRGSKSMVESFIASYTPKA